VTFSYNKELYSREAIEQLSRHFLRIAGWMVENPGKEIGEIELLSSEERRRLLVDFNRTRADYPRDKTTHQLFEEQAARTPDRIAVYMSYRTYMTYAQLNKTSGQSSSLLIARGVASGSIVAVMLERSMETIIGILGILKAGAAYLPIDPDYPQERIDFMLKDSNAKMLLRSKDVGNVSRRLACSSPSGRQSPTSLAYIIYTSGTTGNPKGIMVEHRNAVSVLAWFGRNYALNGETHVLQMTNYTFDPSVEQIFATLLHGAVLYLAPGELSADSEMFRQFVNRHRINIINFVPRVLEELLCGPYGKLKSLQVVICGGERLDESVKQRLLGMGYDVYNHYGPTETTIDALVEKCSGRPVTLGKPIANVKCYILDRFLHPVPVGVAGELCISGSGVARGYMNNAVLTREKFIRNPFETGERMYRSGDSARWLPHGKIEFLGRMDHQVKIRGYRVELGEIESRLLVHEAVKEAAAIAKEAPSGGNYLCAYVVGAGAVDLREYLSRQLPDYMIPAFFVEMQALPLTATGKIDRSALPEPRITSPDKTIAPRDKIEETLVGIWSRLLGRDVGIEDDFFESGGHSLTATKLVLRIHKEFNVKLSPAEIFNAPDIKKLAGYIKRSVENKYAPILPVEEREYYPLSSAQKRLYILQRMDTAVTNYNIAAAYVLEGILDIEKLENTFKKLILRHESFRTSFEMPAEEPIRKIHHEVDFNISVVREETGAMVDFVKPFDLSRAPLLRVGLVTSAKTRHILMVDIHHIISDGASIGVLVREFMTLYRGGPLAPLNVQHNDFTRWLRDEKEKDPIRCQEAYWLDEFSGEIPVLELPTDFVRPVPRSFEGDTQSFTLPPETAVRLKRLAVSEGATLYMVLLALFNVLLARLGGREEIVVGTPVTGRNHTDSEHMIGMFVNTLPLKNNPSGGKSFKTFLKEVKEKTLNAFENQEYQFEDLVERLAGKIKRDTGRNPLFDVLFVLQNIDVVELEIPGVKLSPYKFENRTSKFDITLNGQEIGETLHLSIEYCSKLFKRETIERYIIYINNLMSSVVEDPQKRIADMEMISQEERRQLLYDFNDTAAGYPNDKTIHQLFEEQVVRTPDRIAVVAHRSYKTHMTYSRLNQKSNLCANLLREQGVVPGSIAAIKIERSIEMIIGILGILKAGAAYLPIEPDYPQDRIDYMMADSNAKILLSEVSRGHQASPTQLTQLTHPTQLSYIIYTSGSTGKPKGVMVEHASAVNILWALQEKYPFLETDTYLLKTSYMFDVSVTELFGWFLGGGRLSILESGAEKDPGKILNTIENTAVTHVNFVPSMFNVFLDTLPPQHIGKLSRLRYIFLAGEALLPRVVEKFRRLDTKIVLENIYGPTEATVYASGYPLSRWDGAGPVPIGTPMPNTSLYILDKFGNLQPVGVPGELCISGAGLARGYLNNPELTAKRFNKSYKSYKSYRTYISYRTGDSARWLPDGKIEFLGRMDHQVKIRGYRVELGEIESRLLRHDKIKEAVVLDEESDNGEKGLHAYLVIHSTTAPAVPGLRKYLSQFLPGYMIPSVFAVVEKIPRTSSGKIDRKALPASSSRLSTGKEYIKPATHIQEQLANLWQQVLGLEKVGIDDNFFDLGGNSFHLVRLGNRLKQELNRDIPMISLFKHPTVRSLSQFFRQEASKDNFNRKKRAEVQQRSKGDIKQRFQKRKRRHTRLEESQ
ncbi:MAG: amino acid adenylation domain-containing protein, partial [bacterium]|nr:amino acid adenylation domain-containing protein [bacterium]